LYAGDAKRWLTRSPFKQAENLMDGLLFLGAIFAIVIVIVGVIIKNGQEKDGGVSIANAARGSLLRKVPTGTETTVKAVRRRSF